MTWYLWTAAGVAAALLWSFIAGFLYYKMVHSWYWTSADEPKEPSLPGWMLLAWPLVPAAAVLLPLGWLLHWPGRLGFFLTQRYQMRRQVERIERAHARSGR